MAQIVILKCPSKGKIGSTSSLLLPGVSEGLVTLMYWQLETILSRMDMQLNIFKSPTVLMSVMPNEEWKKNQERQLQGPEKKREKECILNPQRVGLKG